MAKDIIYFPSESASFQLVRNTTATVIMNTSTNMITIIITMKYRIPSCSSQGNALILVHVVLLTLELDQGKQARAPLIVC